MCIASHTKGTKRMLVVFECIKQWHLCICMLFLAITICGYFSDDYT